MHLFGRLPQTCKETLEKKTSSKFDLAPCLDGGHKPRKDVVGARPIDGHGVLSIVWHFFVFWWSFMSTSTQTSCYVMVILGWGWVGWGGAMTFMSTCIHTSCYVIVMFSCTCTHTSCYVMVILGWGWVGWGGDVHVNLHTHVMLRYCHVLLHLHTHVMLRYGYLGVGLGGVGWGCSFQVAHTRHATLLLCSLALAHTRHATLWLSWGGVGWGWVGWGGVGQWRSCQLAHTRPATLWLSWGGVGWGNDIHVNLHTHVMLRYCYVLLHLHTHVMLRYGYLGVGLGGVAWGNDVHVNLHTHVMLRYFLCSLALAHTRHATLWLSWGGVGWGGVGMFMSTCIHTSCYVIVMFSCTCTHTSFFFLSTVAGTQIADRWWKGLKDYIPKSFPRRLYHGVNTKEHPELEKFVLGYCWRKSLGPLTPHRFLEELCKAVKAMKRFWEEGKKCCIPKKHELMSKNKVVLEMFKTLFFTSTWEKMTFRCSENDIFVDEKLLKPYGRLWVGNHVVTRWCPPSYSCTLFYKPITYRYITYKTYLWDL